MRCCVPCCNNVLNNDSKSRGISFHTLPSKISRRNAWTRALCITKSNLPLYANVCSEHFAKELINVGVNGKRRLCKNAVPLSVQVCLICLDTDSALCTLNRSKLEMVYETLTGLSVSNSHVETVCAGCAQRLRDYSRFREECLKSNQLMIELVERQSLTVQNIRDIKQQNQTNSNETEHENKENATQTEINALHETVDLKYEISEDIYDIHTDDEDSGHRNYETGEINHENVADLRTEYEETVNTMQVNQKETETYAPYIEVERIEDVNTLTNGKIIENVMGKSRDKFNIYLKRDENDTVEIYVIENKETDEHDETSNEVEKIPDMQASEKEKTVEQESQISNDEAETISVKDKSKEIFAMNLEVERTMNDEHDEIEVLPTYNEVEDNESLILRDEIMETLETNLVETVMNDKQMETQVNEIGGKRTEEELVTEDNMESENNDLEIQMRDRGLIEKKMELNTRDVGTEVMEVTTDELSERRDGDESESDRVERILKCAKCSEIFLYEDSYNDHIKRCIYEDNSQRGMKKSGNFILKFDEAMLKKIKAAKVSKEPSPQSISKKRIIHDSDDEKLNSDIKKMKHDVRLKLNFISDSSEPIEVRTPSYNAGRLKYSKAKLFVCNGCDYRCSTRKLLNQHILIHTGEKPYSCHVCEYKCTQKSHLDQHLRTHTGVKPYFCEFCKYRCVQKSQLDQHLRRHTGDRPYSCSYCEYTCSQMGHLDQHLRVHTGERPFTCKLCKYNFVQKSGLLKHMSLHDEESS